MACRFTLTQRVVSHRVSNFHTPFRHDISSTHSLPDTLTSLHFHTWKKNVHVPDHIHDQKIQRSSTRSTFTVQVTFMTKISKEVAPEVRVLPKLTVDDKASSKTHLVRLMHNVETSKFKIFSVAKARCWNTRFSPKTPKVFPVLSSSSRIQFLG